MLKCIIVDDEELALDLLEDYIGTIPYLKLEGRCRNALEAKGMIQKQAIDLIFLDILMPGMTGLQFIQSMSHKPMVILISAYSKYALDAFEMDVVDYLVKPVPLDRFTKACNKAWEYYQLNINYKNRQTGTASDYFFVNADYSLVKINVEDVVWIEGMKDYIKIYLKKVPKPIMTLMNMKTMEGLLPDSKFIRIHKSYIIGIKYITAIRKNSVFIEALELPVGANYKNVIESIIRGNGNYSYPL